MNLSTTKRISRRWGALVGVIGFAAMLVMVPAGTAVAASSVPYVDNNAVGSIGLCDQHGNSLTKGNVNTKPFIWKAVDETAAKAPYNAAGATATLYAFQPRKGVDASEWNGAQLSGSSRYSTPDHPTASMTGLDRSLSAYLANFPAQWNGLLQLRIFLGAPNHSIYNQTYDATNIKVTGSTWTVVGGTKVPCAAGSSVSIEQVLATDSAAAARLSAQGTQVGLSSPTPKSTPAPSGATGSASAADPASPAPSGSLVGAVPSEAPSSEAAASTGHGSSFDVVLWVLIGFALIGGGFVTVQWIRSRT
jgi:hypothetical protein